MEKRKLITYVVVLFILCTLVLTARIALTRSTNVTFNVPEAPVEQVDAENIPASSSK